MFRLTPPGSRFIRGLFAITLVAWAAPVAMTASVAKAGGFKGGECMGDLEFVSQWDGDSGGYGDVWGEGDIAYVAQFGDNNVHFIDISNPQNPDRFLEWTVASPNTFASAQDVKVGDGLLFISLEGDSNDSVEVVDVRDPFNPEHVTWIRISDFTRVHNTFYDNGFLYMADSATPEVVVVDLRTLDPDDPPVRIEDWAWRFDSGNSFVHDITVKDGRLYVCAWDSGLYVYDVTNVAQQAPVFLGQDDGDNTHAVWPSADGRWAVTGEEREGGAVKLYEMTPNGGGLDGGGLDVALRFTSQLPLSESFSAHNIVVDGMRVYVSYYQAGVLIYDINPDAATLELVTRYDTFPGSGGGFAGCWGVYPFLGEDRILASDMQSGFYLLKTAQTPLRISYPNGLANVVHPVDGATLTVQIAPECDEVDPATARVFVSADGKGDGFTEITLEPIGGALYEALLPPAACGAEVRYYVSVDSVMGETVVDPPGAPNNTHAADVISTIEVLFFDDFESDLGWTTASDHCAGEDDIGDWERVNPNGTSSAPEDDFGDGDDTQCFVTGQGAVNGDNGDADVDGGPFWLTSPEMTIGGVDAEVSYARWYVNNDTGDQEDFLVVELSVDDGPWEEVEVVDHQGPIWNTHTFHVSDVAASGETMRLRFVTEDCPNNSITEAAVDHVLVRLIECNDADTDPPFIVHDQASTWPFSGYIDPRMESSNGVDADLGVTSLSVLFSEPIRDAKGGGLTVDSFEIVSEGDTVATVAGVDDRDNPLIVVSLAAPIAPGEWVTLVAHVEDLAGNPILSNGNAGPDVDEPDRIDVAALPCDVDQNGTVQAFDLLRFRQINSGTFVVEVGQPEDYIDVDRNGSIQAIDLLRFRQLWFGTGNSTLPWHGESLSPRP
jgi:hypothetical protein